MENANPYNSYCTPPRLVARGPKSGRWRSAISGLTLLFLSLALAVLGYFFFGIVVAIYVGIWLHKEKMYYAQGVSAHLFGATGSALGLLLAWAIWRLGCAAFARSASSGAAEPEDAAASGRDSGS